MPDILICSLVAAVAHARAEQALSAPHVAGHHKQVTDLHGFDAVNLHFHQVADVDSQHLLQQIILLILDDNQIGLQIKQQRHLFF